ncbi:MAG: DNA polymerase II [Fibrobacter sp.]|jgi:DNA polymerase-2|nr:DNA polymerase II [Fibrobacter sp.]
MMTDSQSISCFLLNYSFRDFRGHFEIILYAVSESGSPVRIVIDHYRPLLFIPAFSDYPVKIPVERKKLPMKAMDGTAVDCLYFQSQSSFLDCIKDLKSRGNIIYESDIHPVDRYLMERFVNGGFEARGILSQKGNTLTMHNPVIRGTEVKPVLKVMSIDIETDVSSDRIYSIASFGCGGEAVFIEGDGQNRNPIWFCKDEKELLASFFRHLQKNDPDVIIGWNVIDFDLRIIQQRCRVLSLPFDMGRDPGARIVENQSGAKWTARLPGRVVMDVPVMLRAFFHKFEEYSLDFVASEMLGETKDITLTGREKIAEINRQFQTEKEALARYNLKDARLTKEIFDKAGLLPGTIERSKLSGHLLDRTGGSIAAFDYLYLPRLHRKGFVAGDSADIFSSPDPLPGGFVLEPVPGIYENVLVLDFRSLYPSIISTFKIDPLGYLEKSSDRVNTPAGTSFSATNYILPEIIENLLDARSAAKKDNNPYLSQAIKILMNSFYGVLGAKGCRFFSPELASTITKTGQYIFKTTVSHISSSTPCKVIYGDTDSLFVLLGPGFEKEADQIGSSLSTEITSWLSEHLKETFNVNSRLKLEYENHFRYFLMPAIRGTNQGSKKHYCGSITEGSGFRLVFKGMESARSDWTELAKEFQHELVSRVFSGKELDQYVNEIVLKVKSGAVDNKLIYKKRLRKQVEEYMVNIPPHVQAAKLLESPPHLVKYCITIDGPQPLQKLTSPLDYNHYIDCQLKPVADSILELTGTNFDKITSGQQDLFEYI